MKVGKMVALVLLRHAQTQPVPDRPAHEWQVTAAGRERCAVLAERLRPLGLQRLYTSIEAKAQVTGEVIAEQLHIPCQSAPDLRETQREHAPFFADPKDFRQAIRQAMESPELLVYGEERFADAERRFSQALELLSAQHPDEVLGIVTHGTVLALYLARISQQAPYPIWEQLGMPCYAVLDGTPRRLVAFHPEI